MEREGAKATLGPSVGGRPGRAPPFPMTKPPRLGRWPRQEPDVSRARSQMLHRTLAASSLVGETNPVERCYIGTPPSSTGKGICQISTRDSSRRRLDCVRRALDDQLRARPRSTPGGSSTGGPVRAREGSGTVAARDHGQSCPRRLLHNGQKSVFSSTSHPG